MKKKTKDKIEILSIVLSILAFIISLASFGYTVYKDEKDSSELISIFRCDFGYNDILSYDSGGYIKGRGIINGVNYTITLSNNSKQRISLVDYDISYSSGELTYYYGNMVNAIKDSNNQPVSMPIILDAGESMVVTYEINTIVPQHVNMLLLEKYGTEAEISQDELRDYLGENNLDIFGNDIKYYKYEDGNYLIQIEDPHFPVYNLNFITSKGSYFECELSK
jgi:hypothetical protein